MFSSNDRGVQRIIRRFRRNLRQWISFAWQLLTTPARWIARTLGFVAHLGIQWWNSRRWRHLLWGTPTLVVLGVCVYFAMYTNITSRSDLAQKYLAAARIASAAGQWKPATLYFERALELGIRNREDLFDLAVVAQKSGDTSRMVAVLERLAPDDHATYAPAHLWKAIQALSVNPVPAEKLKQAEIQLRFALTLDPGNQNAHAILGDMYFQRGFMDGAANHLARGSKTQAHTQLLLAKACVFTKQEFEAENAAKLAERLAAKEVGEDPNNEPARLEQGEALMILERFQDSINVLSEGIRLNPEEQKLRAAVARVYLEWANSVQAQPGIPGVIRTQAFQLVAAAMQWNPDDPAVFDEMMKLVELNDAASEKARAFLRDNIATGRALGISHLLLGTSLENAGDLQQAGFHLEQSFKLLPEGPVVANNLAWHLVYMDPPEPERAMRLIEAVIEKFPNVPAYIDTRGHVYLKLKEWSKAVDDFQISLTQFANEPSVHSGLAEAYQNLGMFELSTRHRKISEQLLSRVPQKVVTPEFPEVQPK